MPYTIGKYLSRLLISVLLLLVIALVWFFSQGYHTAGDRWYPFISAVMTDHYTTGPFAMTSNTREDNPVWSQLPEFNQSQARMAYTMTRGEPAVDVAWLFPHQEWPDEPALPWSDSNPNKNESLTSRQLTQAGYGYDRVSRSDVEAASWQANQLRIGQMTYRALLVTDLSVASPELMASLLAMARSGVPIIWVGDLPRRANGWSDHRRRDAEVVSYAAQLQQQLRRVSAEHPLSQLLIEAGIDPALRPANKAAMRLRSSRRKLGADYYLLLFNETDTTVEQDYQLAMKFADAYLLNPETAARERLKPASGGKLSFSVPAGRTRILQLLAGENPVRRATGSEWDEQAWREPPRFYYPHIRWWWPGNAVEAEELRRELGSLYEAGFGGVELQTLTIGFTFEQLRQYREAIYQVGTRSYLDNVRLVLEEAGRLGMTVDLTLGSGWSSGAPFITERPQQQLLNAAIDVSGPTLFKGPLPRASEPAYVLGSNWIIKNTIGEFDEALVLEAVVAAKITDATEPVGLAGFIDLSDKLVDGKLSWQVPAGEYRLFAFYRNNTSHNAVAAAYPGALEASPIIDHLHPGGIAEYIRKLGQPWLQGLAPYKPRAWFVDSFELMGELPWTEGFGQAFFSHHGYPLEPYLPLVFMDNGESKYLSAVTPSALAYQANDDMAERIREDYELTRQQLFVQAFVRPLKQWANSQGVQLRMQAHGGYGDYLDSYQLADIPESEGLFAGGSFEFLKLASSAGHISGAAEISSESFINMSFDYNQHTLADYYWLAGHAFSAGINRTVCHGYAYHFDLR